MDIFGIAFLLLIENEGGFVNDPDDPGGATKYGLTLSFLRGIDGYSGATSDFLKQMDEAEAKLIYKHHFWRRLNLDELPPALAVSVFDCAVHMGRHTAGRLLQNSINTMRPGALHVDGIIGPLTIAECNAIPRQEIMTAFPLARILEYIRLCEANPKLRKYFFGWLKRVVRVVRGVSEI